MVASSLPASPETAEHFKHRIITGIPGFDSILKGGLPKDRLYLVQGEPGTGKTTFALQFLLEGVRRGEPGLFVTLSETREELDAVAASHAWSLDQIVVAEIVAHQDELKEEDTYTVFPAAEVELGAVLKTLLHEAEKAAPVRCVVDSLSEMRLLARDPLRFRRQLVALKEFFKGRGCTTLLLEPGPNRTGDLQSNTFTHGVITLEQMLPNYGAKRRRLHVSKLRGVEFSEGYHDYTITAGGIQVFPRLVAADHDTRGTQEDLGSGLPELDALTGGGIRRGTSTLLVGPSGVGKSTLAAQYAIAAVERGEPVAIFTFDESRDMLLTRARSMGLDLEPHVATGLVTIKQIDTGQLTPGEFASGVVSRVDDHGARLVVIDSLNGYINATPDERSLLVQMHELLTCLSQKQVATFLIVGQHGLLGENVAATLDMSYLADTVMLLRYFEHRGSVHKAISVVKKRSGPHERTIRELILSSRGVIIGEPLAEFSGVLAGAPVYTGSTDTLRRAQPDDGA